MENEENNRKGFRERTGESFNRSFDGMSRRQKATFCYAVAFVALVIMIVALLDFIKVVS